MANSLDRDTIERQKTVRARLLLALYRSANGDTLLPVRLSNLAEQERISAADARSAQTHLVQQGMIKFHGAGGRFCITPAGVHVVESTLGDPQTTATTATPPPASPVQQDTTQQQIGRDSPEYDVAVSFAGEDRHLVEPIVRALQERGVRVFYDLDVEDELWGKNLVDYLHDLYLNRARFCIMFVSEAYARKAWPNHERQAAQERSFNHPDAGYVLPVRIDGTKVPGLPGTIGYLSIDKGPERIAELTRRKLGIGVKPGGASPAAPARRPAADANSGLVSIQVGKVESTSVDPETGAVRVKLKKG